MRLNGILIAVLIIFLGSAGVVLADQPVPAVPETQGLVTSTGADVVGLATETDAGAWTLTNNAGIAGLTGTEAVVMAWPGWNQAYTPAPPWDSYNEWLVDYVYDYLADHPGSTLLDFLNHWAQYDRSSADLLAYLTANANGIHPGSLNTGQVQYTTAYDASILAQSGHTVLLKSMNINTGNKVAATQSNLDARTLLTYIATGDGGNLAGSENLLIDGAGNSTPAWDWMLCPFVGGNNTVIPAYCNIVQAGSSYDLTVGSVTTAANDRFVGTDATVPVALNYNINVKPYDTTSGSMPAMGSVSAYIKAHIQEARSQTAYNVTVSSGVTAPYSFMLYDKPAKAEDLQYSETTSATGLISSFAKSMSYSSQATSTPLKVVPVNIIEPPPEPQPSPP